MKILVIDPVLLHGCTVSTTCAKQGHDVVYAPVFAMRSYETAANVLLTGIKNIKIDPENWMKWIDWCDFAVVTGSTEHRGGIPDFLRKQGKAVVGPGSWGVRLELSRKYGNEFSTEVGMTPPWTKEFDGPEAVVAYVRKNRNRYVVKLDQLYRGDCETFVGQDPRGEDTIETMMEVAGRISFSKGKATFYLSEFFDGLEISFSGMFNGKKFLDGLFVSFEENDGFAYDSRLSADQFLDVPRFEKVLSEKGFHGILDVNGFWVDGKFRPTDWTPRFGMGMTEFFAFASKDFGAALHAVATGEDVSLLRPDLKNRLIILANILDASEQTHTGVASRKVMVPKNEYLPVIRKNNGCFVKWPFIDEDGKWQIVVMDKMEYRRGVYLGVGDTLDAAMKEIKGISSEVYFTDSFYQGGQLQKSLQPKLTRASSIQRKEEWVQDVATEMRHVWDR